MKSSQIQDFAQLSLSPPEFFIPEDIILEIVEHLPLLSDVLNFSLTSSRIYTSALQALYTSVDLRSSRQCKETLSFLVKHPEITRHIRKIVVRPNLQEWLEDTTLNESWVMDMIERMSFQLDVLNTFIWDGSEMASDQMWSNLKNRCPHLSSIGSSMNESQLRPDSHFYSFRNLVGFSLTIKPDTDSAGETVNAAQNLPEHMWEMLLASPDIEQLTINISSNCSHVFDLVPLTRCRWPRLRKLEVGNIPSQTYATGGPLVQSPMVPFLTSHHNLETLSFRYPDLSLATPLHLRSFHGFSRQMDTLLIPSSLQHLELTCIGTRDYMISDLIPRLRTLDSLVSLNIWLDFGLCLRIERERWLTPLLMSCPGLLSLELLFSWTPSPNFHELSAAISDISQLNTIKLTIVHHLHDEEMLESAVILFRGHPRLKLVKLRYANKRWIHLEDIRLKKIGTYEAVRDETGALVNLFVHERGVLLVHGRLTAHRDLLSSRYYRYILPITTPEDN